MGRMKDLFIQMQEEQYQGNPAEYLKEHASRMYEGMSPSNFLCPNCMKEHLAYTGDHELTCIKCGQDFIQVRKALRFK